ncbi:unnamed protein product, partial [Rotaria sp. Silwood2]
IIEKSSVTIKTMISTSESLKQTFVEPKHDTLTSSNRSSYVVSD